MSRKEKKFITILADYQLSYSIMAKNLKISNYQILRPPVAGTLFPVYLDVFKIFQ